MYSTEKYPSQVLQEAVEAIGSLPGVGSRSALRLALHLLGQPADSVHRFANAINRLADDVHYCHICQMIADADTCAICADRTRDARTICVVESVRDVMSIEATGQYRGVYHVLGGIISPIDGIGPSDLHIRELVERIGRMHEEDAATADLPGGDDLPLGDIEVILALSGDVEGGRPRIRRRPHARPLAGRPAAIPAVIFSHVTWILHFPAPDALSAPCRQPG